MDDERTAQNLDGGGYFKELLERIRDIRASEKEFMGLTTSREINRDCMIPLWQKIILTKKNLVRSVKSFRDIWILQSDKPNENKL